MHCCSYWAQLCQRRQHQRQVCTVCVCGGRCFVQLYSGNESVSLLATTCHQKASLMLSFLSDIFHIFTYYRRLFFSSSSRGTAWQLEFDNQHQPPFPYHLFTVTQQTLAQTCEHVFFLKKHETQRATGGSNIFKFYLPGSQQHPDSAPEVGEDAVTSVVPSPPPPAMTEEEQQELQEELVKVSRDQGLKGSWWFRESRSGVGSDLG